MTKHKRIKIEKKINEKIERYNFLHDTTIDLIENWAVNHFYITDVLNHNLVTKEDYLIIDKIYNTEKENIQKQMTELSDEIKFLEKKYKILPTTELKDKSIIADLMLEKRKEYEDGDLKKKLNNQIKTAVEARRKNYMLK